MVKMVGYSCPECGYTKRQVTHSASDCSGAIVRIADEYQCDACGKTLGGRIKCTKCGHTLKNL